MQNGYTPQDRAANKSVKNVFLDHADPNRPKGWFSSWFGGKKADPKPVVTKAGELFVCISFSNLHDFPTLLLLIGVA